MMRTNNHRSPHRASAPVSSCPPIAVSGRCDDCGDHASLREYWNGWFVCGQCATRMAAEDAKFGLDFGE
jgi:hypothetical protein